MKSLDAKTRQAIFVNKMQRKKASDGEFKDPMEVGDISTVFSEY